MGSQPATQVTSLTGVAGKNPSSSGRKAGYHHGSLRRALLTEARRLIRDRGLGEFNLREVARRAGVTHGAAYRHFADKNALAVEIALLGYEALAKELRRPLDSDLDLVGRMQALALRYVEFSLRHPGDYRVMFGPRLNQSGRYPELERAIEDVFRTVEESLFVGMEVAAAKQRQTSLALLVQAHGFCDLVHEKRIRERTRAEALEFYVLLARPFFEGISASVVA